MAGELQRHLEELQDVLKVRDSSAYTQAAVLIENIFNCSLNAPENERAFCSSLLFNKDFGILKVLKATVLLKEYETVKANILRFLVEYCDQQVNRSIGQYLKPVKESSVTAFTCDSSVKVKTESINVLTQLLKQTERSFQNDLDVKGLVSRFWSECSKGARAGGATLRGALYTLMGVFTEQFPDIMEDRADRLLVLYLSCLKQEMENTKKKPELLIIAGCFKGITGYLNHFSQSVAEGSKHAPDIYRYAKKCIVLTDYSRYDAPKAALTLLKRHCALFKELITDDAEVIYKALEQWNSHINRDLKYLAISTTDAILEQISLCVSEHGKQGKPEYVRILKGFMTNFHKILNSPSSSKEALLAIKGYGKFAKACAEFFSSEDMKRMFEEMLRRSEQCYQSIETIREENLYLLPTFLEALANMTKYLKEISFSYLYPMEKMIVTLFDYYPKLGKNSQELYRKGFTMFIEAMSSSPAMLKKCLSHIVYQCVIRTCSYPYPTSNDEETALNEADEIKQNEIKVSYKNFLPIWAALLEDRSYKASIFDDPKKAQSLKELVYDNIVEAVLSVLKKLNLIADKKNMTEQETELNDPLEEISSDPTENLVPKMLGDFLVLVNAVDFFKYILTEHANASFLRWLYIFVEDIITLSTRFPVISGFYKLLQATCVVIEENSYFKNISKEPNNEKSRVFTLLRSYMKEVLSRIKQYKEDLLISCLQFILSLPTEIVKDSLEKITPAFQTTFQLGLSHFELAELGLCTLEKWNLCLDKSDVRNVLSKVLPCLDDYLQSSQDSGEKEDYVTEKVSLTHSERKIKRVPIRYLKALINASQQTVESPLMKLRLRIVNFLGTLGGSGNVAILQNNKPVDLSKAIAWDSKEHLSFALPFQDMKPTIFLDSYLPRVVELSLSSSNRQVRVVACELLHALVLFMLGKSIQQNTKTSMEGLYRKVFPALLKLSCSAEQVAEQLFSPLLFQIIHWLTGVKKAESEETMALLDVILDGVTSSTDSSLRDFSAKCVKEFLHWSIKKSSSKQLEKNPANPKSLFKRLYSLALHPNVFKRLGAAIVFNNIYAVFREEESLVDIFTLEILVNYMNSLSMSHSDEKSLGTTEQCEIVMEHLEKIIKKKYKMLLKPNENRNRPVEFKTFKEFSLAHVTVWLLNQCGSPHAACRHQCMKLVYSFLPLQKGAKSPLDWVKRTLDEEKDGSKYFTDKFEKGSYTSQGVRYHPTLEDRVKGKFSLNLAINWLENFLGALDCYCWVLGTKMLTCQELFVKNTESKIMASIQYFVSKLSLIDAKMLCKQYGDNVVLPSENESFNRTKCTVVVRLYNFLLLTLNDEVWNTEQLKDIANNIFCEEFITMLVHCLLCPSKVGFNISDFNVIKNLPQELEQFMKVFLKYSTVTIQERCSAVFSNLLSETEYDLLRYLPLDLTTNGIQSSSCVSLIQIASGYLLLHQVGLLSKVVSKQTCKNIHDRLLSSLKNSLVPLSGGQQASIVPLQKSLAEIILKLVLVLQSEEVIKVLLDEKPMITEQGFGSMEPRGLIFYQLFSKVFNEYFVSNPQQITALLSDKISFGLLASILQGVLTECFKNRSAALSKQICSNVVTNWSTLVLGLEANMEMRLSVFTITKLIVSVSLEAVKQPKIFNVFIDLLNDTRNDLSLKGDIVDFLPAILQHCSDEQALQVKDALKNLITSHFPMNSADLTVGESKYIEYMTCLNKFLRCLISSASPLVFEPFLIVIVRETDDIYEQKIKHSLISFVRKLGNTKNMQIFKHCMDVFMDENKYQNELRQGVIERVCIPLLNHISVHNIREFFKANIASLTAQIQSKFTKNSEEAFEIQLINKTCCFKIITLMYGLISKDDLSSPTAEIVKVYMPNPVKGNELTSFLSRSALNAYREDIRGETNFVEIRRKYHCAAYNCLISIISCTQTELKFFTGLLFTENSAKGSYVFENLIDLKKQYRFESEISVPFARKQILQLIRMAATNNESKSQNTPKNKGFVQYMSSQYLMGTSLSQDVNQFDFNNPVEAYTRYETSDDSNALDLSSVGSLHEEQSSESADGSIELDDLNQHECMVMLLALMDHMKKNKIYVAPNENVEAKEMPSWMQFLHSKINGFDVEINIKLFIAKLIVNKPKVFEPYGAFWFSPLVQLILSQKIPGSPLNYFVVDIIIVMLSWSSTVIPEDTVSGKNLASSILDYLLKFSHHTNRSVLKNNLQVIKTMLQAWKDRLEISYKIIFQHFNCPDEKTKDNMTGLQLLGLVLSSGFPPYQRQLGLSEQEYFLNLTRNLSFKYKDVFASAAEVCSLAIKYYKENNMPTELLYDMIRDLLVQFSRTTKDRFVVCLHSMQIYYPDIVDDFISPVLYCLSSLHGILKTQYIQCLAARIDHLQDEHYNIYKQIKGKELSNMITHKEEETQLASIKLARGLIQSLKQEDLLVVLPLVATLQSSNSEILRDEMYELFMWVYDKYRSEEQMETEATFDVLRISKEVLLVGINDTSNLSLKLLNFWRHESRLPNATIERLIEILRALYSTKIEKEYLSYATNLLLQLTSLSPDYSRPLFDSGLDSEENFRNYHINFSWQRQNVAMTPLFVASQRSSQGSYSLTQGSSVGAGMLRATQKTFDFSQTNQSTVENWMNPSVQISSQSFSGSPPTSPTSLFAMDSYSKTSLAVDETDAGSKVAKERKNEILRLKRRFLKDQKARAAQFATLEIKRQKLREAVKERQKAARDRKVVMYRKYRVGELPDIQINHSELIVPLQALAQLDSKIAQKLFSTLFSAIVSKLPEKLSDAVVQKAYVDIQDSLDSMMKLSTSNNPAFAYAIENICYENKRFKLDPQVISNVSVVSVQQPVGILLLEKQLLNNIETNIEPKRKRMRGAVKKTEDVRAWLELAKVYESIEDYDFLRSIFSSCISKADITRNALASEARNDFETALSLYREASSKDWEDSPTEEEEEYWDTARLRCYERLSKWTNLNKFTVKSIEQIIDDNNPVDVMKIWDDEVLQETYLPCYIKSNIKLLCQGNLDEVHEDFQGFVEKSLKQNEAKEHLQTHYCDELALLNIFNNSYGGAQHYLNISVQRFLDEWSHMSSLITTTRHAKLQRLQKIVEMEEFIKLMSSQDCHEVDKVISLLSAWSQRLPDEHIHSTLVWDDVILNRCSFIRKMKSNFQDDSDFLKTLDIEEVKNILIIAEVARKQGNYAVASQYLRDSSEATLDHFSSSNLQLLWRHIYVKIHCDKVKMFQRNVKTNICALVSAMNHLDNSQKDACKDDKMNVKQKLLEYKTWKSMITCLQPCDQKDAERLIQENISKLSVLTGISTDKNACVARLHEHCQSALELAITCSNRLDETQSTTRDFQVMALMKMIDFCDDRLKEEDDKDTKENCGHADTIIRNLLKAMKLNSEKARLRFPRLLQLIDVYKDTREVFLKQSGQVPCWMFLAWTNQIVALIDKSAQSSLVTILNAIARAYPQALMYPLRVSSDQYHFTNDSDGKRGKDYFTRLQAHVTSPLLEPFADSLGQLTNPTHVFKDQIDELRKYVRQKNKEKVLRCYKDLVEKLFNLESSQDDTMQENGSKIEIGKGSFIKKFSKEHKKTLETLFGKDGRKLVGMDEKSFKEAIKKFPLDNMRKAKFEGNLKDFSPWLSGFQKDRFKNHLEIPGQYVGHSKPMIEYHVKIVGFDQRVLTMKSLRQPKRITIRGDDEKEYKFLVKGGEDLRLDQRLEQIFELMNIVLRNDPVCSNRLLRLKTYQVVPVTNKVGIIEWVDNTVPYQNLLEQTMDDRERKAFDGPLGPSAKYSKFLAKYISNYSTMYNKATRSEAEKNFHDIVNAVPWDLLRRAFQGLAASSEAYFVLRNHFIQSHACMCIAQYILGIGDRHLSNTLIDKTSGGVVGIDFGHAFGTATQLLPIPELIPFRLTQQMINILLPLQDASPYKQSMIAVLQAFRKHASSLLNTMDVFINEPLLDWEDYAKKAAISIDSGSTTSSSWYPKLKVNICKLKLNGINPAHITQEELRHGHSGNPALKDFICVARGDASRNCRTKYLERTELPDKYNLTVEEQVDCLVDQATDANILGRTYIGWRPWV